MSQQPLKFTRKTKRGIGRKRELMHTVVSTKLWVPDHWLFDQTRIRKHVKPAVLLRDIVHQWAIRKRLAPDAPETIEETATIALLREIKTELADAREELRTLKNEVSETARSHGDYLDLIDNQMTEMAALSRAQHNMFAQAFSVLWAVVEMIRQYVAKPFLSGGRPEHENEAYHAAGIVIDELREEGLLLVDKMNEHFHSPQPVEQVRVSLAKTQPRALT